VDVIVTEAFVGNVILKMYEGVSKTLLSVLKKSLLSSALNKVGAAMVLPSLKKNLKAFDASEYGGAPLLGLKGLVVKVHGSSKAKEVKNSLLQCVTFHEEDINGKILEKLSKENKEEA
jgi:glycerol-3-phosphate acyltransferase PlsX